MNRSGIALVLVLVVLAALLLLGVPFLASQSASLSGSRQLAQRTQASLSRDAAEGQGVAVAVAVTADGLLDLSRSASATVVAGNRFLVRPAALPGTARGATHGSAANAIVEDESGKLDANNLGEEAWGRLLAAVGVTDWEGTPQWRWYDEAEGAARYAAGTLARDGGGFEIYGEWSRNGSRGQLARTLAQAGLQLPLTGHRVAHIDQLLQVDPARVPALSPWVPMMRIDDPQGWEVLRRDPHFAARQWSGLVPPENRRQVPTPTASGGARRKPLSRAELELLRPHLTLHAPAQARAGMVDVGTSLGTFDTDPGNGTNLLTVLDAGSYPQDQWLVGEQPLPGDPALPNLGIVESSGSGNSVVRGVNYQNTSPVLAGPGEGIAFLLPATVNPNTAGDAVLATLVRGATAGAVRLADLKPLSRTNSTAVIDAAATPPVSPSQRGALHPAEHHLSAGVVTVESHGAGLDGAARRTAGEERRTVVQVVDQERGTIRRWSSQADWWALAANRQVSNLIAAPLPDRTTGSPRLVDAILDPTGPLGQFDQPGRLLAAPLAPYSGNAEWGASWRVDFGISDPVTAARADSPRGTDNRTDPSGAQVQLLADGARLTGAGVAGYLLAATAQTPMPLGPWRDAGSTADATGLGPSWLSLNIRFDHPSTPATLLASRTPVNGSATSTLGVEISGAAASNDSQHRWELLYDADAGLLRLVVANGAIPASGSSALKAGWDDPLTELIDERALGAEAGDALDLAQRDPIGAAGSPLAAPELRVRFTPVKDRWYHLLIVQVHDQPGGTVILIDGLLGQDWGASGVYANQGDYVTLPSLRLRDPLPAVDASVEGGKALAVARIDVEAPPGVALADLLPQRGLVRIHDEYIAYGRLDGDALADCIRARRINTNTTQTGEAWPLTQDHAAGSRVLPGWFRYEISQGGRFYTGSNRLAQRLGGGAFGPFPSPAVAGWTPGPTPALTGYHSDDALADSATPANLKYRTWSWVDAPSTVYPPDASHPSGSYRILPVGPTITLEDPQPSIDAWPERGQVRLIRLGSPSSIATRWFTRSGNVLNLSGGAFSERVHVEDAVFALVTSIEATDPVTDFPASGDRAFQVMDAGGRVEWIRYDSATSPSAIPGHYFLEDRGFPFIRDSIHTHRGSMRTAFVANLEFPPGASILPVHNDSSGLNLYGLEPGDTVTLTPTGAWTPTVRPFQVQVRFAASDGFAKDAPAQGRYDTKNQWFAFTAPFPAAATIPTVRLAAVVGRGWTGGRSMSTDSFSIPRTGLMPRLEAFGDGFAALGDPQWGPRTTLGPDRDRGSPWTEVAGFQVDAVGAGPLPEIDGLRSGGLGIASLGGGSLDAIPATGGLPMSATAQGNATLFQRPTGLVLINGEVFAYRCPDQTRPYEAVLIARGLLGTRSIEHRLARSTTYGGQRRDAILPVIPLPIGPIGILGDRTGLGAVGDGADYGHGGLPADAPIGHSIRTSAGANNLFTGSGSAQYQAPAFVISDPLGGEVEALVLLPDPVTLIRVNQGGTQVDVPLPGKAITAPWLRGMWGTEIRDWQGGQGEGRNPVIIPWWPRHASALPATLPSEPQRLSALLRSRRYQWSGPAVRLHNMRVDRGPVGHAFVTVPSPGGLSRPELRGFAPRLGADRNQLFDWSGAVLLPDSGGAWSGASDTDVDGAEYRHHLVYLRADTRWGIIADAAAERLEVTSGDIRIAAPIRVLASEAGR
jgi:hypothetical protein